MKVKLKLTYNEFKALIFIFSKIAFLEEKNIVEYIDVREAENLCRKLMLKLQEPPKKRYTVNLNSVQILTLLSGQPYNFGRYEQVVYMDICAKIDQQYVSESHHRHIVNEQFGLKDEFYDTLPEHIEA